VLLTFHPEDPHSYRLVNSGVMLAAQADGASIVTVEGLDDTATLRQGDKETRRPVNQSTNQPISQSPIHPISQSPLPALQAAFVRTGAIQCGYCTPAQLLAAKKLLDENPHPSEAQVREALAGVLCRCTGYAKPVQAVLLAAAWMRGDAAPDGHDWEPPNLTIFNAFESGEWPAEAPPDEPPAPADPTGVIAPPRTMPVTVAAPATRVVNKPEPKVDAVKLAKGRPVFTDDVEMPGMLYGGLLTSPHAHARILAIDKSKALALPGVHAVLTHEDVPRVIYASGGQSYPNPPPYDQVSLDNKVRHVGDRVAIVAAETPELVQQALELIEVEYEILPAVFDPETAIQDGAPVIHDEPDAQMIHDP
ncbi:MAG: hypothetical protein D6790_18410, partial [Caldilineae bacterium]